MLYNYHHRPSQTGAMLLVMVLVLGILSSLGLTAYLLLLTMTTKTLAGHLRTQQAHYAAYASFSESMAHYLHDPQWLTRLSVPSTTVNNYLMQGVPISRTITRDEEILSLDITSSSLGTQRRLESTFELSSPNTSRLDIVLLIDHSGSMRDDGPAVAPYPCLIENETHEPMISAICAAQDFVEVFYDQPGIKLAVAQFATESDPLPGFPHLTGSPSFKQIYTALSKVSTANCSNNGCYTNTGGAVNHAISLLSEDNHARPQAKKYIVLFTDGIPTVNAEGKFCDQDDNNPPCDTQQEYSLEQADNAKRDYQATIYTVGLGNSVNDQLLTQMAFTAQHYYFAPNKNQLADIFTDIAGQIKTATIITLQELPPESSN